jgi:hypothetical protein
MPGILLAEAPMHETKPAGVEAALPPEAPAAPRAAVDGAATALARPVLAPDVGPEAPRAAFDSLDALARLLMGLSLEGWEEVLRRLAAWDASARRAIGPADDVRPLRRETQGDLARYVLIGAAAVAAGEMRGAIQAFGRVTDDAARRAARAFTWLVGDRRAAAIERDFSRLVARGEQEIVRLVDVGRREELLGRASARTALQTSAQEVLDYLSHSPQLQQLITQQSVSLAGTVVDEARERTVTADNIAERLVRALLGRPPREQLPPPPAEVMALAAPRPKRDEQ